MAKKLIATDFVYIMDDGLATKPAVGSYLGRKVATRDTLRRFLRRNERACGLNRRIRMVEVTGSYESKWIAK